jgi:NADPH:quinone reductase-like Zn-dependent oxidoreductase
MSLCDRDLGERTRHEVDRRRYLERTELAPGGVTAATDLFGAETAEAALVLGVPPERISTIAGGPNPPGGVRATDGFDAEPADLERITDAILAGKITTPIAATFPLERIRDAVILQAGRHVHGKIVVTL